MKKKIGIVIGVIVAIIAIISIMAFRDWYEYKKVADKINGTIPDMEEWQKQVDEASSYLPDILSDDKQLEKESLNEISSISGFNQDTSTEELYAQVSGMIDEAIKEIGAKGSLENITAEFEPYDVDDDNESEVDNLYIYGTLDGVDVQINCMLAVPSIGWHVLSIRDARTYKAYWDDDGGYSDIYDLHTGELVRPATKDVE